MLSRDITRSKCIHTDEDKIAFMAETANYCYKFMTFCLKNARVAYQQLMYKILQPMLRWNVQAYMDYMVVTSEHSKTHITGLEELFRTIRKHQLKLNLEKCAFGIRVGKFLGFLLIERGIEANLNKCAAIVNMRSPINVKEVHRLTSKMAALSRFLFASGQKGYPYFQCVKKNGWVV